MVTLRFLFAVLPISLSLLILVPIVMTNQHIVVQVIALLLCSPLLFLTFGFLCVEAGRWLALRGHYGIAEVLYKAAISLMSIFRLGPIRNFHTFPTAVLAELLLLVGKYKDADEYLSEAVNSCSAGRDGSDVVHSHFLVVALKDLGICKYKAGNYVEALRHLKKALVLSLKESFPTEGTTIGMPEEDENIDDERVLRYSNLIAREFASDSIQSVIYARVILYLGAVLRETGNVQVAYELMSLAMKYLQEHFPSGDIELFSAYIEFSKTLRARGDITEADSYFAKARETAYSKFNKRHPFLLLVKDGG